MPNKSWLFVLLSSVFALTNNCFALTAPTIDHSKCIRLEYAVKYVSPALSKNLVDAMIANLRSEIAKSSDKQYIKRLEDSITYVRKRVIEHSRTATAYYWISSGHKYCWQEGNSSLYRDNKRVVMLNPKSGKSVTSLDVRSNYNVGTIEENVPFLGFRQPFKVYRPTKRNMVRMAGKFKVETGIVPHPYHDGENIDVTTKYDDKGMLVQFNRDNEIYNYSQFRKFPDGTLYPATVVRTVMETEEVGSKEVPYIMNTIRYQMKSVKVVPAKAVFEPYFIADKGSYVADHRYSCAGYPLAINYIAGGRGAIDGLSQSFKKAKDAAANKYHKDSVVVLALKAICYFVVLLMLGRVVMQLRRREEGKANVQLE